MTLNGGPSKTDIELSTKGLSQNSITVTEYLDQKEESTEEDVSFGYSDLTKELFEMVYLEFYYWCGKNGDGVEWFVRVVEENSYVKEV